MKVLSVILLALATASAAPYDDVQVTYRGRLKENGAAPAAQTVSMKFCLYATKRDATPAWTTEIPAVRIDHNGLFQVALRGDEVFASLALARVYAPAVDEQKVERYVARPLPAPLVPGEVAAAVGSSLRIAARKIHLKFAVRRRLDHGERGVGDREPRHFQRRTVRHGELDEVDELRPQQVHARQRLRDCRRHVVCRGRHGLLRRTRAVDGVASRHGNQHGRRRQQISRLENHAVHYTDSPPRWQT